MLTHDDIENRIKGFKSELGLYPSLDIARRHIIFGECAILNQKEYFNLRSSIADNFKIHPNQVLVVGSSKLGFSIAPQKRYKHFSTDSDIDVVIVSEKFFDTCWEELYNYEYQGGYWEKSKELKNYLFQGWVRPDKYPPDKDFDFGKKWWAFFNHMSASRQFGGARVRGAVYRNWKFLEHYQKKAIDLCLEDIPREKCDGNQRN